MVAKAIDPAKPEEGTIWIYEDITAERAARESLQASRDALERAVAERTAELQAPTSACRPRSPTAGRPRRARSTSPTTTRSPGCPTGGCWRTA